MQQNFLVIVLKILTDLFHNTATSMHPINTTNICISLESKMPSTYTEYMLSGKNSQMPSIHKLAQTVYIPSHKVLSHMNASYSD